VSAAPSELPPRIPHLRFDTVLGRGGMATVWRAWHLELNRVVAVKVLDPDFIASAQDIRQFMVEMRTMSELDHPGLVRAYEADCQDGRYYYVMDYVDGYTLGSLLERGRRISQEEAAIVCESVCGAMGYAWDAFRIVHCDLKPDNLMVDREGNVKILDLGLCQSTAALRAASPANEVLGTPGYISPEQVYEGVVPDCRADIYSLGATLYHLVTGRMLFPDGSNEDALRAHADPGSQAPDPRRFAPGLSGDFVRLLAGMLVKDRDWRYPGWGDLFAACSVFDQGGIIPPLPDEAVSSLAIDR